MFFYIYIYILFFGGCAFNVFNIHLLIRFWQSSRQEERRQLQIMSGTVAQLEEIERRSFPTLSQVPSLRYDLNDAPCCRRPLEYLKIPPQLLKGQILLLGTHNTFNIGERQMDRR